MGQNVVKKFHQSLKLIDDLGHIVTLNWLTKYVQEDIYTQCQLLLFKSNFYVQCGLGLASFVFVWFCHSKVQKQSAFKYFPLFTSY